MDSVYVRYFFNFFFGTSSVSATLQHQRIHYCKDGAKRQKEKIRINPYMAPRATTDDLALFLQRAPNHGDVNVFHQVQTTAVLACYATS